MIPTPFSFISSGAVPIEGVLRVPEGDTPAGGWPGVVLSGPISTVKEQVVADYADRLTAAGYVTLAFDHRNFGASGGAPRQHEDVKGKRDDLAHAVTALAAQHLVGADRIALVGIGIGAGYALTFSAGDERVRAVACVAGTYLDPATTRAILGERAYQGMRDYYGSLPWREHDRGAIEYMPAVARDETTPGVLRDPEVYAYFRRARANNWVNRLTSATVWELTTADFVNHADDLHTPALMVHGRNDVVCSPRRAQSVFERIAGLKEMHWMDTRCHTDLWDGPSFMDEATDAVVKWFGKHV